METQGKIETTAKTLVTYGLLLPALIGCCCCRSERLGSMTEQERAVIHGADTNGVMRVLTINDSADLRVLRDSCRDFTADDLLSEDFRLLAEQMIATVTSPEQDGVGIAGPQVGLNRRVVTVQRLDKKGKPFEVYPDIRIISHSDSLVNGREGCLSIPGRTGYVMRYNEVKIRYRLLSGTDGKSNAKTVRDTTETVEGFTARIFQHECDHLDGILYIDKENDDRP